MANGKILRQVADHLSECCQTLEAAILELKVVMSRQDIPDIKIPRNLWYEALVILSRSERGIRSLLESMRARWNKTEAFRAACTLMEDFRSETQHNEDDVEVSEGMWLTQIGINEHFLKAEVYVGADLATFEKYRELSYALLEIGPTIAAQESDLHLIDKLESLSKLPTEEFFESLMSKPNRIVDVGRVNDLVIEHIADMRRTALRSIELKHISATGAGLKFEPIRVVLECKLKHTENALEALKMFVQKILEFEPESTRFNGSGQEGERLVQRAAAVCFAAQRLVDHLRESLKRRLALANEAIPQFLNRAGTEVSVLLESLRPSHRTGTPAPTLWAKLPIII